MKILQIPISTKHKSAMFFDGIIATNASFEARTFQDGEIVFTGNVHIGTEIIELGEKNILNDNDIKNKGMVNILVDKFIVITEQGNKDILSENYIVDNYDDAIKTLKQLQSIKKLELIPTELSIDYCKKWNVNPTLDDFHHLYIDGKKASNTLYRIGGFGADLTADYFVLLKQVESRYDNSITKDLQRKSYLANCSVIIDSNGNEKQVFDQFDYPHLQGGQIYCLDNNYYNIETQKLYCNCHSSISSEHFLFLENRYNKDRSKRGVLKINKADGTQELFQ